MKKILCILLLTIFAIVSLNIVSFGDNASLGENDNMASKNDTRLESVLSGMTYYIRNVETGWVVDSVGYTSGGAVLQYSFHGQRNQKWIISQYTNGTYLIKNEMSSFYLGVTSAGSTSAELAQYSSISNNTIWYITSTSSGYYKLVAKSNLSYSYAMSASGTTDYSGAPIKNKLYSNNSNYCDEWQLFPVGANDISLVGITAAGHDHISRYSNVMKSLGMHRQYDVVNTGYISTNDFKTKLSSSNIIVTRSHGGYSGYCSFLLLNDSGEMSSYIYSDQIYSFLNSTVLLDCSDVRLACFIGCQTAYGTNYGKNLPTATVNSGASCAIGFADSIGCVAANEWMVSFFSYLETPGSSIAYAVNLANAISGITATVIGNGYLTIF